MWAEQNNNNNNNNKETRAPQSGRRPGCGSAGDSPPSPRGRPLESPNDSDSESELEISTIRACTQAWKLNFKI